jgi:hypothetical protein
MNIELARKIIGTLAQGIHPATGEVMPPDSPYNDPLVIRALFIVSRFLEDGGRRRPPRDLPANAGKPWEPADDEKLRAWHAENRAAAEIAKELHRTEFAIESRLTKLGLLPPQAGMRFAPSAEEPRRRYFN